MGGAIIRHPQLSFFAALSREMYLLCRPLGSAYMKRCPECRRNYYDDTLLYCLDDGATLLEGPASGQDRVTVIYSERPGSGASDDLTIKDPSIVDPDEGKQSVAILPFTNLSGDPAAQFYEFSLADAVITELARLRSLVVRPSSMIAKYQGGTIDPCQAGREMRVRSILSTRFMVSGSRIRVTAQLLDVRTGDIIWGDRIDSEANDVFALQDAIALEIIKGLQLHLSSNERDLIGKRPAVGGEAYEEYLRGRDKFGRFVFRSMARADCDSAISSFSRAVELDPHFALAWSGLGACFINRNFKGLGSKGDLVTGREYLLKALAIDPNVIESRVLMCFVYMSNGEKKKARAEVAKLHEQFPDEAAVHFVTHVLQRLDGEYERSIRSLDRLQRLDPSAAIFSNWNRARLYSLMGDRKKAFEELDAGSALEPDHPTLKAIRGQVLFIFGAFIEAREVVEEVLAENPDLIGVRPLLALASAALDDHEAARKVLSEQVLEMAKTDHDVAYWTSSAYALLGDKDAALEWLEVAVRTGFEDKKWMEKDPSLATIRDEPRFGELMQWIDRDRH